MTRHAVFYRGKVTELFSPHLECNSTISNIGGRNIFLHNRLANRLDFGAIGDCPKLVHSALNISTVAAPELGDEVISYGFEDVAEVYRGSVASVRNHDRDCVSASNDWTGKCIVCKGEFHVEGEQHAGLSGAAIVNVCGYIGLAHSVVTDNQITSFAGVVAASMIHDFLDSHINDLANVQDCNISVVQIPVLPFRVCS